MTDRQLMGFLTIVEKKSFTAAAEAMYISQSALSQQIRHLERQLGFALFDRSTRQPTLTEAGRSFYERAREIQHLYDRAVAEGKQIQHLSQQHIKRLVIGCLDEQFILIWQDLLTTALPLAQSYAPCPVRYYSKESLYAALLRGEVQIAALLENEDIRRFGLDFLPFAQVTPPGCPWPPSCWRTGLSTKSTPRICWGCRWPFITCREARYTRMRSVPTCKRASWILWTPMGSAPLVSGRRYCCCPPCSTAATPRSSPWTGSRGRCWVL